MSKTLFSEFDAVSSKQWKQKIQFDLKGADYNKTLIWKSNEDIAVKPFYHADDFDNFPETSNTQATKWKICQSIFVVHVEKSNLHAIDLIERGTESIEFIIPLEDISIDDLLKNIDLNLVSINFKLLFLSEKFIQNLSKFHSKAEIYIDTDIIGNLAKTGNWYKNLNDDFQKFENIIKATNSFSVDTSLYQNAGANMVQQLAYGLSHANEYLNHLDNILDSKKKECLIINFKVSVGSNYFFEIAKLRALRLLWKTLAAEYNIKLGCHIFATPSKRNKTIYDFNTNMLRTTTECMSAILGGANTICNLAYDVVYHKNNEFGERIARNQLLILKHESYFNAIDNPSDGAYYIESLTHHLAEKALLLFKDIETSGGFLKQLKTGTIQRKIKESASKKQQKFDIDETVLLGTNKHANPNDRMKDALELYPFTKNKPRKTLIEPIIEKRLAEHTEQERLKKEL